MNNEVSAKGLEATLKSTDTEEWIDLLFYRPIGYRWADRKSTRLNSSHSV